MPDSVYPVVCPNCAGNLYGPVTFCPYCGIALVPDQKLDTGPPPGIKNVTEAKTTEDAASPQESEKRFVKDEPVQQNQESSGDQEDSTPQKTVALDPAPPQQSVPEFIRPRNSKPKLWKWTAIVSIGAILVSMIFYFTVFNQKRPTPAPPEPLRTESGPGPEREFVREALQRGVQVSVNVSTIAKQENLVKAAKKLADISGRYASELTDAENSLNQSINKERTNLEVYHGIIKQMSRYSQVQLLDAIDSVLKDDLSARERMVLELIQAHLNTFKNGKEPAPEALHSDFSKKFRNLN